MIPVLCTIGPKLRTHCLVRNLPTHYNPYCTSVAIGQQGLENWKTNFLTMFLGFQKLLSTLHLIVVECQFTVYKTIVSII